MRKTDKFDFFIAMGYIRGISFPEAWQQLGIRQKSSNIWIKRFQEEKMIAFKNDTQLLIKIHFHTNEPWKVAGLGGIYDIVVEDMDRQAGGLQG